MLDYKHSQTDIKTEECMKSIQRYDQSMSNFTEKLGRRLSK